MTEPIYGIADPETAAAMTGLEFLEAMRAGVLPRPPIGKRIPMEMQVLERGKITLSLIADDSFLNPGGIVHGGVALTALDTAMGLAVMSTLGRGKRYASTDTAVRFLRPLPGGKEHRLLITGTVVSSGRTMATASGEVRTTDGKLVATGTSGCAIFSLGPVTE
ncbi:MAG: PaaI family thioesterase [Rhodocyclaceae bacterium]|nr:PaaI family thioesterase [Rhodocyclaceae bacterium]MCA3592706.1 PaaI family thioesterase [Methylocystis sp.]MCA3653702.1 PaaI family thioesterase [Methylobacterium sp.]